MGLKIVKGDLIKMALRGEFELIAHGCNCMCAMGKGLDLSIMKFFPLACEIDGQTVKADENKLGTCTFAECPIENGTVLVVNAYTQFHFKGPRGRADYKAIKHCMKWIKNEFPKKKIGLPFIGAGLARGNWTKISAIIEEELAGCDVTIVEFQKER